MRLPARFHRVTFSEAEKDALVEFLEGLPPGIRGRPRGWWADDDSWRSGATRCG